MIPIELVLDYAERIDALDEHDRDRLLSLLGALAAVQDDLRAQPLCEALVAVGVAVGMDGLPVADSLVERLGEALADLPDKVLDEQLVIAAASGRMPATLMGKQPGIGSAQSAWQAVSQMLLAEQIDRAAVLRNAKRVGPSSSGGTGWYVPDGEPPVDPDDRDLELCDPDYSPPEDDGLPRPDDTPTDDT